LTLQIIGFDVKKYNRLIEFLYQNKFIKIVPYKGKPLRKSELSEIEEMRMDERYKTS
jgi:hypothetical protein